MLNLGGPVQQAVLLGLGVPELVIILIIAIVIFGPKKIPEIGSSIGKALREFKKGTQEIESETKNETESSAEEEKDSKEE
ncbi:MAG: twin-arginine translocase TatA/TatE family subunit [Actinobacteria bacterium]|nr:twin-arginine translocase TatA/TatE family subunit [Actinomycetota bacterium]